jgi:hypothetical protein
MNMKLSALKSLKKPGSPPRKLNFRQKLARSAQKFSHAILNGSSKALSKAVIFLAAVEVCPALYVLPPPPPPPLRSTR